MSAVCLYFDADSMERAVVWGLRERGINATTALDRCCAAIAMRIDGTINRNGRTPVAIA